MHRLGYRRPLKHDLLSRIFSRCLHVLLWRVVMLQVSEGPLKYCLQLSSSSRTFFSGFNDCDNVQSGPLSEMGGQFAYRPSTLLLMLLLNT